MNFLAHLHLASLAESSLLGNLMADFVRGRPDADYSPEIASGIMLHRRIDRLTDGLEAVKEARSLFSRSNYRVSAIALDVLWDHFLSRRWEDVDGRTPLPTFIKRAKASIDPLVALTPPGFQRLNQYIWQDRWLERYAELPFVADALNGMAVRRPKLEALSRCMSDIEQNYDRLEAGFLSFYPEMMAMAEKRQL
ncbi:acyl carrier protein phosphodiesterase [Leminorella grimontii]|uniref:Acyl carrier protein phosphodiesterase n=1 Tax=Leminorella grimontii TaxID=82981 RepID=A0AAV5MVV9_9GAMM|nr:ACP phosphodiesterase [Leminorella grimontii]KFC95464.1 acyl carrier protein phosphodiesterase [Leminorella grimontii ATCC 33999 = DSM 5078]GKX53968.1 acyl carrier protein phosphodiesterase [Leminorella grimontii]VFS60445.1 acyl carrier protein phosphodiesterase [Leminorella grimontii]